MISNRLVWRRGNRCLNIKSYFLLKDFRLKMSDKKKAGNAAKEKDQKKVKVVMAVSDRWVHPLNVLSMKKINVVSWSSLVEDVGCIGTSSKLLCLWQTKNMQYMRGTIPHMLDCWTDPIVHLFLLKISMEVRIFAKSDHPAVWPGVGIKSSPNSSKSCQKSSHNSFY